MDIDNTLYDNFQTGTSMYVLNLMLTDVYANAFIFANMQQEIHSNVARYIIR